MPGIRAMTTINVPAGATRTQQLVAVVDDVVYLLNPDGSYVQAPQTGLFPGGNQVQMAAARLWAYAVDGTANMIAIDVGAGAGVTASPFVAAFGEIPIDPRLICFHMDCLVLAGGPGSEQIFCMSRIGEHDDFDFSATDGSAPVLGDEDLGQNVGQPINALMPATDRELNFGCDNTLWRLIGHPRQGGGIVQVSDKVGVIGANAWASDPGGTLYFVGENGFYAMRPGGAPVDLSTKHARKFFELINRATHTVTCVWDTRLNGCWIFITGPEPADYQAAPQDVHLFYHAGFKGFWRIQFPLAMEPVCAVGFDGDTAQHRVVMMGARDGYIRTLNDSATSDQGVAIESYVLIGPLEPGGAIRDVRCTGVDFILGELPEGFTEEANWSMDWQLQGGRSAGEAALAPLYVIGDRFTTAGEQRPVGVKIGAQNFIMKASNSRPDRFWSIDRVVARFVPAGRRR